MDYVAAGIIHKYREMKSRPFRFPPWDLIFEKHGIVVNVKRQKKNGLIPFKLCHELHI